MNIITRHDLAKQAAARWWLAYLSPHAHKPVASIDAEAVHRALVALGDNPPPEHVDAVMPNGSWTRLTCSACYESVERVAAVDVTGGEYTTHICEACAKRIAGLF